MTELTSLRNIGKELEKKLKAVDISTAEELKSIGSKEAFVRLKLRDQYICLVHLYALEGAISDIDFNQLAEETKQDLKKHSDSFK
ncbi:MAG: TfoX/Sxy family protein [Oscillospiraceae bacterium]|nr:TfoX/Sxy family protein [Oscillospiraceae bacterium]